MTDDPVRDQYEGYPYPPRDPADERTRLITGSPSHLDELNHYVFGGRRDLRRPIRVLVAGGGTGDAAIMLAQQLADAGAPADILYIDLSEASRRIALERARVRGLANIRFERLSLLDLPGADPGPFDYVDCCGVLHHLEDPEAGLAALAAVLANGGGMGLMVYGALGRIGVYHAQEMLRLLAAGDPAPVRLDLAGRLVRGLPGTNWLRRNPFVNDHLRQGDAGLFDLLLHARDRAYRVPEVVRLAAGAGLRIVSFIEPAFYDPLSYLDDGRLRERALALPAEARWSLAELLAGNLRKHVFYVVRQGSPVVPPDPGDPRAVPVLRDLDGKALAAAMPAEPSVTARIDGITFRRSLPPLAGEILGRIDGRRRLEEIHAEIAGDRPGVDWPAFRRAFTALFAALNGLGKLYLRADADDVGAG